MNPYIKSRVSLLQEMITQAIQNELEVVIDFDGTIDHIYEFEKQLEVNGKYVYIYSKQFKQGVFKSVKERYNTNNEDQLEELKYQITHIVRGVKKSMKNA